MSKHFDMSFLISGQPLQLSDSISVINPTVGQILKLGSTCETIYAVLTSEIISDPYSNMVELDNDGIDYESTTPFDVFVWKWGKCVSIYNEHKVEFDTIGLNPVESLNNALSFWFGGKYYTILKDFNKNECIIVDMENSTRMIHRDEFNTAVEFIDKINQIDHYNEIHPATKIAKQILIDDMRSEKKRKSNKPKKDNEDDESVIGIKVNALLTTGAGGITEDNYQNISIYKLNLIFSSLIKREEYNHAMIGVYTGNLKMESVDKNCISWYKP